MRKFSTLIKRMVVELDRDPAAFPDGNIVEVGDTTKLSIAHLNR
jgi:hypothetical protein